MNRLLLAGGATLILAIFATAGIARAEDDDLGKDTFDAKCATCHGADGKGKTEMGVKAKAKDLTDKAAWKDLADAKIEKMIREGTPDKRMTPFKEKLSDEEIAAVTKYVHKFQPK